MSAKTHSSKDAEKPIVVNPKLPESFIKVLKSKKVFIQISVPADAAADALNLLNDYGYEFLAIFSPIPSMPMLLLKRTKAADRLQFMDEKETEPGQPAELPIPSTAAK